jgi:hypothetical protein
MLPIPEKSPVRPTTSPISVEVRSMDITPGPPRGSFLPMLYGCLPVALLMPDMLDARDVRPLPPPLGSRSLSIVLMSE